MAKVPHAIEQALARYGLKLSWSDLRDLEVACREGYGRIQRMKDGSERHLVSIHGKQLVAVYLPYEFLKNQAKKKPHLIDQVTPLGRVITILDLSAAKPGAGRLRQTLEPREYKKRLTRGTLRAWRKGDNGKK